MDVGRGGCGRTPVDIKVAGVSRSQNTITTHVYDRILSHFGFRPGRWHEQISNKISGSFDRMKLVLHGIINAVY